MKTKSIYVLVLTVVLSLMMSLLAFASSEILPASDDSTAEVFMFRKDKSEKQESADQKAEMKERHQAMKAKWDALNKEQKEEIYIIQDQLFNAKIQIIDKYLEFEMIDNESAAKMKTKIEQHKSSMREKGELPNFKFRTK